MHISDPDRPAGADSTRSRRARLAALVAGCVLIPIWQGLFAFDYLGLDRTYRLEASSGVHQEARFVYFLYYLGLFPVATEKPDLDYSRAGAERVLEEAGDTLVMEWKHTLRFGDLGRTFLYLPGAWLRGSPKEPSLRPCHIGAFVAALVALYAALWWAGMPLFGAVLVVLLGSNPFQLFEVYARQNIFGWPITAGILVLALHVPLVFGRKPPRGVLWALPVVTGVVLASIRQIRTEAVVIIFSAAIAYLTAPRLRWWARAALVALLALSFGAVSRGWTLYFRHKHEEARRRVEAAGGHPYVWARDRHHTIWPSIWCGLGDYGGDRGYAWDDRAAVRYALPILERDYGVAPPKWDGTTHVLDAYWDDAKKYYRSALELPHYDEVLRGKVVADVGGDPLWYAGILARRALRVLDETTPIRVGVGRHWVALPMHGLVVVPALAFLLWARVWGFVRLIAFAFPLSATALAIYSGDGTCYYSCYHIVVAAFLLTRLSEAALGVVRRQRPRAAVEGSA